MFLIGLTLARLRLWLWLRLSRLRSRVRGTRCSGSRFLLGRRRRRRVHIGHKRGEACEAFAFFFFVVFSPSHTYPLNESDPSLCLAATLTFPRR